MDQSISSKPSEKQYRFQASQDWDSVENHSNKRLKAIYTPYVLEKDIEAIAFIEKSKQEKEKKIQMKRSWRLGRRDEMRTSLVVRHNSIRELEEKSGIRKIRHSQKSVKRSDYGLYKPLAEVTHRQSKLSLPKLQYRSANPYAAIEFRGLVHTDHPTIAEKRSHSVSPKPSLTSNDVSLSNISMNREFLNKSSLGTIYDVEETGEDHVDSVRQIEAFDEKELFSKLGINATYGGLGIKQGTDRIPNRISQDTISSNFTFGGNDI